MAKEKKRKSEDSGKKEERKDSKKRKQNVDKENINNADASVGFSLLAENGVLDSKLSSLFDAKPTPAVRAERSIVAARQHSPADQGVEIEQEPSNELAGAPALERDAAQIAIAEDGESELTSAPNTKRKRRQNEDAEDLEDQYLRRLAAVEAKEGKEVATDPSIQNKDSPAERATANDDDGSGTVSEGGDADEDSAIDEKTGDEDDAEANDPPPQHETLAAASTDLEKANRTVFLGNVSTSAITSRSARRTLEKHLTSFFPTPPASTTTKEQGKSTAKLESLRFRSTPYSPTVPKKAAFAKREVVDATTHATNAYAVYSTQALARDACRRLNGTTVLDRHLRVDSVAHPAPVANKRCVFVGNLGFVDDESNINAANEAAGWEKRKSKQQPADVEEGLWRLFGKHGTVESVRVVRDRGTRVGKGIAYVQFTDENGVEGALAEDGKKAPPMLPRRLRVTRAKAMKKKAKSTFTKSDAKGKPAEGYRRKVTSEESTYSGRVGKLMGKAAAALTVDGRGIKRPEAFVFEGHRASAKQGKSGLKLGKGGKKKGKPTTRSARRGAAYKAKQPKK